MVMTPSFQLHEAGQRASDIINQHIADHGWWEIRHCWIAVRLADGSTDGNLYDKRIEAVRRQVNGEFSCAYVCLIGLGPAGSTPRDMAIFLMFNREAYKAGVRMTDPDVTHGGTDVAMSSAEVDYQRNNLPLDRREQRTWDALRKAAARR